jgi:hypothetical protein
MLKKFITLIPALFLINNINTTASANDNSNFYISTYSSPFFYNNSQTKKSGFSLGAYSYYYSTGHFLEGKLDYSNFELTSDRINQYNAVLSYTNYQLANLGLKVGTNLTATSYSSTDQGAVLFMGINYFSPLSFPSREGPGVGFNAGMDFYTSFYRIYNNSQPVFQLTPAVGVTLGDYYSSGTFDLETKGYFIKLPQDSILENKNMLSVEGSLTYNYKNIFSIKGSGWVGEQAFAVRNSGFIVYNVPEKHYGGYGLAVNYSFSKNLKASVSWNNEHYYGIASTEPSLLMTFPVELSYDF